MAFVGQLRRDAVHALREARPSRAVRRDRPPRPSKRRRDRRLARAKRIGQREQDPVDLGLLAFGERDDVVVERRRSTAVRGTGSRRWSTVPCTMPGIDSRCSARTTTTYRPLRSVMIWSCRYFAVSRPRVRPSSVERSLARCLRRPSRMSRSAGLALSATSPDGSIARRTASLSAMNERAPATSSAMSVARDARTRSTTALTELDEPRQAEQLPAARVARRRRRGAPRISARSSGPSMARPGVDASSAAASSREVQALLNVGAVVSTARAPRRAPARARWTLRAPALRGSGRTRQPERRRVAWGRPARVGQSNIIARPRKYVAGGLQPAGQQSAG